MLKCRIGVLLHIEATSDGVDLSKASVSQARAYGWKFHDFFMHVFISSADKNTQDPLF